MRTEIDKVVGVTFDGCQKNIAGMKRGDKILLVREPENQWDRNAIRAERGDGKKLGYVKAGGWLYHYINESGTIPSAYVHQVVGGCNGLSYGLVMKVTLPG